MTWTNEEIIIDTFKCTLHMNKNTTTGTDTVMHYNYQIKDKKLIRQISFLIM
jgi:hypothetical protein